MKQEQWDELKRLHGAATAGEWNIDTENNEGDYGSGDPDDARSGFSSYVLHAPSGTVCDTLNSDLICVNEESDEEGYVYAWDEVGGRNMKWVAALHNAFPAIVAEREAAQRLRDAVANWITIDCPKQIGEALAAFDKESKND